MSGPDNYANRLETRSGQPEEGITRNHRKFKDLEGEISIYDRAIQLYFRAQKSRRVRSAGIL